MLVALIAALPVLVVLQLPPDVAAFSARQEYIERMFNETDGSLTFRPSPFRKLPEYTCGTRFYLYEHCSLNNPNSITVPSSNNLIVSIFLKHLLFFSTDTIKLTFQYSFNFVNWCRHEGRMETVY